MGDVDYGGFVGLKTDLQILRWICRPKGRPTTAGRGLLAWRASYICGGFVGL